MSGSANERDGSQIVCIDARATFLKSGRQPVTSNDGGDSVLFVCATTTSTITKNAHSRIEAKN